MTFSLAMVAAAGLGLMTCVATSTTASAQYSENEQTVACMGDALRLCSSEIPDKQRIIACLAGKHAQLSAGCVGVFDANMRALRQKAR
jgi:hypothetical protein